MNLSLEYIVIFPFLQFWAMYDFLSYVGTFLRPRTKEGTSENADVSSRLCSLQIISFGCYNYLSTKPQTFWK